MTITLSFNPTTTVSLSSRDRDVAFSITANASARFSSVLSLAWGSITGVPASLTTIASLTTTGFMVRTDSAGSMATRTLTAPAAGLTITNPAGLAGDPTFALANDLAALEGMSGTGLVSRTASETYAQRTLTAPAAGITVSNGDGVSGNPTLALADDLAGLEGMAGTGLVARTASNTYAQRTLTAPAAGITVSNGDGVSGNPTLALANDLAALEAMSSTGLVARTASETYAQRTLTAPAAGITVSNGNGVSGNPTLALANDLAALEALSGTSTIYYRSGSDTWTAVTIGSNLTFSGGTLSASGGGVGTNLLYNANFQIDQRNVGASTAISDDAYCFDRWYALTQTASVNVSQQSDQENTTPYNLRMTQNQASAQRMGLAQILETRDCRHLRGQGVVLSGRIRCSSSQAIRYAILEWTGTADSVTSDVVNDWTSGTYTAGNFFLGSNLTITAVGSITPSANTWTSLTDLTGTLGSSLNNLIVMIWTEGTAAQNVTLDIGRLKFELGSASTTFIHPYFQAELDRCLRYYEKSFPFGTAPAQNAGTTGAYYSAQLADASTAVAFATIPFRVRKRATPTFVMYNPSAANGEIRNTSAGLDWSGTNTNALSDYGTGIFGTTPATTTMGQAGMVHWSASAEL